MSGPVKVHFIPDPQPAWSEQKTACGKRGMQCPGYRPHPGHPGEYDTPGCDRFDATPHREDVTCARCRAHIERQAK